MENMVLIGWHSERFIHMSFGKSKLKVKEVSNYCWLACCTPSRENLMENEEYQTDMKNARLYDFVQIGRNWQNGRLDLSCWKLSFPGKRN